MTQAFKERRNFVIGALGAMKGLKVNSPEGAFYAFPDVSSFYGKTDGSTTIHTDEDMSMYLLHTANVSTVNGGAFGNDKCIRLSFATSMENLKEAMERIAAALSKLQ